MRIAFLTFAVAVAAAVPSSARLAYAGDAPAAPKGEKAEKPSPPVLVELTIKGGLAETPPPTGLDGAPVSDNLKGLIDKIAKAKDDASVKGLLIRVHEPRFGLAKAYELRRAIGAFRAGGKKAFAVLESAGNVEYFVATAADEIVMPESGWLMVKGLAAEVTFYKNLFEKLGVKADMMQVGEFKGAAEPYTRTAMSGPFREELSSVLNDNYMMIAEAIAKRQGIAIDEAKKLIDGGPYTPGDAKRVGLINRIAYNDELEAEIAKGLGVEKIELDPKYGKKVEKVDLSGLAGFLKMMQMLSGENAKKSESKKAKIAVIVASGMITTGKSKSSSLLGDGVMGSDTVIKHLREAEKNETVKAIVLRVDSPGGSALASDLIWREVVRIEKPIVACMSDVAASGGYYISMGCDKIVAEPSTITGSIGVVGGKIALGGLMDKVGLSTDVIEIGKNGLLLSTVRPFSDSERTAMKKLMDETYKQFVSKAARGRKMDEAALEKLARGRIYTGRQAKEKGLVDEIGTLDDAIATAKSLAKIPSGDETETILLPKASGVLEDLFQSLEDRDIAAPRIESLLPQAFRGALARLGALSVLLSTEPVAVVLPFELQIH